MRFAQKMKRNKLKTITHFGAIKKQPKKKKTKTFWRHLRKTNYQQRKHITLNTSAVLW